MNQLYIYHYAILKKLYRNRYKDLVNSLSALTHTCLLFLAVFIWSLIIDRNEFWNYSGRNPFKSRIEIVCLSIGFIFLVIYNSTYKANFSDAKKAVIKMNRVTRWQAYLYLSFYVLLFAISMYLVIIAHPKH